MNFKVIFCSCCLVSIGSNFLYSMEPQTTQPSALREYDPVDGQVVLSYEVSRAQALDFLFNQLKYFAEDQSPESKAACLLIEKALVNGIEKLYKRNPTELEQFIDAKRKSLTPEQQQIVDACLNACLKKCESKSCVFTEHFKSVELWRCKNAVFFAIYYSLAALIVIMFLEKVGCDFGLTTDWEQAMARLDDVIHEWNLFAIAGNSFTTPK